MSERQVEPHDTITGYPEESECEQIAKGVMDWPKEKVVKELALMKYWRRHTKGGVKYWQQQIDSFYVFRDRMGHEHKGTILGVNFEPQQVRLNEQETRRLRKPSREVLEKRVSMMDLDMIKKAQKIIDRTLLWRQVDKDTKKYTKKGREMIKRRR